MELEKISTYSALEFETYALKIGYSFVSGFSTSTTSLYKCDKSRPDGKADQLSRTFKIGMISPIVQIGTTDKQYYLEAFDYAKANNYIAIGQEQQEILEGIISTWYYFSNNVYTYIFYTFSIQDGTAFYNIQVFKNAGE